MKKEIDFVDSLSFVIIGSCLMSIVGFILMYIDKRRAKKNHWRIKESTLFITSALFGSPGVLLGMYAFRHKTKHASFVYGVPAILFIQIFSLYYFNII